MAIVLSAAAQNAACNGVVELLDAGEMGGMLKIMSGKGDVLVVIRLARPAFGVAVDGVAEALGLPLYGVGTRAAGTGLAPSTYDVTDASGAVIWSGSVPGSMTIDSETIAMGQIVNMVSWTHTQPSG